MLRATHGGCQSGPLPLGQSHQVLQMPGGEPRERPEKLPSPSHGGQEDLEIQSVDWQSVNKAQRLKPGLGSRPTGAMPLGFCVFIPL